MVPPMSGPSATAVEPARHRLALRVFRLRNAGTAIQKNPDVLRVQMESDDGQKRE